MTPPVELVRRALEADTTDAFETRVADQADFLRDRLESGDLETRDFALGLEIEGYAVTDSADETRLWQLPNILFAVDDRISKELGRHNVEINTDPVAFRPGGFETQSSMISGGLAVARSTLEDSGDIVLDAMWTTPPKPGSVTYLSAHERTENVTIAEHMRADPRYYAIDNEVLRLTDGAVPLDLPGFARSFPTILFESLATSIQPHLQIPDTAEFPAYFNVAIRTLGPMLGLACNSPFLPPDLYDADLDPMDLVAETPHELRIAVFEQSVNHSERPKVRVPGDIETTEQVIDRVNADDLYAPFLSEWTEESDQANGEVFAGSFPEFEHKRGTYWRWVRAVVGGDPVPDAGDERSVRIEYRPLPTQPTVTDIVGFQALTAGLLVGLVTTDHPLTELPWEDARASFYEAAADGLAADLSWVRADGTRTTDKNTIFEEVFEYAERGLTAQGFGTDRIDALLGPIEARWQHRTTPSLWKKQRVREHLESGSSLESAIQAMQAEYIALSRRTGSFAEWL